MNRFKSSSAWRDTLMYGTTNPASFKLGIPKKSPKPRNKPKSNMKQYGDKGYKPSTGAGVSY